jgi:peptidoglycan/xylan/chitin deacetylase (PgdA/CDA1 family)
MRRAARWGECRFLRGDLILGYHRVAAVANDPWHMCVKPEHLAQQLEVLRRRWRPVTLQALLSEPAGSQTPFPGVAVTFDDAYLDVLEAAIPILERFEVPATVFVVSGSLGETFWWDRLLALLQAAPASRVSVMIPGPDSRAPIRLDTSQPLPAGLHAALTASTAVERTRVLEDLRERLELPAMIWDTPLPRAVSPDELGRLSRHPLIEIGAHTHTHPDLSRIGRERLQPEVGGARRVLEDLAGKPVTAFAYPHGGVSPAAKSAVQQAGFALACAGQPGRVRASTDRLLLPRLWPADLDGEGLGRFLRRWTGR